MIINTSPPSLTVLHKEQTITDKVVSIEVARTTVIQGIINLTPGHNLTIRPGDFITLNLPFATYLLVQTYTNNKIVAGCYLSTYLDAVPDDPEKQVSEYLPIGLRAILESRGIPPDKIAIPHSINLGSTPTYGSDPEEIANACGYHLYSDKNNVVRLSHMTQPESNVGVFSLSELSRTPSTGLTRPLTANRIISTGVLTKVKEKDLEYKIISRTAVRGGYRTVTKEYKVSRYEITETETIVEPKSQVSSFSSNYDSYQSYPNSLLNSFYYTPRTKDIESSKTIIITRVDRDGNIKSRETIVTGVAAKGLSDFYSAWASAEVPPPPDPTEEEEEDSDIPLYSPKTGAALGGDYNYNPNVIDISGLNVKEITDIIKKILLDSRLSEDNEPDGSSDNALTIRRPSGLFNTVVLEVIKESWEWDVRDTQDTLTNPHVSSNSGFSVQVKSRDKVEYSRVRYLPIGAILPECGDPLFGYQEPTQESRPIYRNPTPLKIAEKETILYQLDEAGQWSADRVLEQVVGLRNAQHPIDAMRAVQYPEGSINTYATDRTNVALNVATQLTLAVSETLQTAPPSKPSLDDKEQYDLTRDYRFEFIFSDADLLDRSIQVTPSSFSPNIPAIAAYSRYQAMAIKGESMAITIEVPLSGLTFDIPAGSLITIDSVTYSIQQIKATIGLQSGILSLTLWPY